MSSPSLMPHGPQFACPSRLRRQGCSRRFLTVRALSRAVAAGLCDGCRGRDCDLVDRCEAVLTSREAAAGQVRASPPCLMMALPLDQVRRLRKDPRAGTLRMAGQAPGYTLTGRSLSACYDCPAKQMEA